MADNPTYPDGTQWAVKQTGVVKFRMSGGTLQYHHFRRGWIVADTRVDDLEKCGFVVVQTEPKK